MAADAPADAGHRIIHRFDPDAQPLRRAQRLAQQTGAAAIVAGPLGDVVGIEDHPGILARRTRRRALLVTFFLLIINLFIWLFIPEATIGGIVLTLLLLPLIRTFIVERRN